VVDVQDFTNQGQKSQDVWLVYHNQDSEINYVFDCSSSAKGLIAPFNGGTTVKNLLYPYEEYTLGDTPQKLSEFLVK